MARNLSGTVHKDNRRENYWTIKISLGVDGNGKRIRKGKSIKGTKSQAKKELARMISQQERGELSPNDKITFGEYARFWLENHVPIKVPRESTRRAYRIHATKHLIPFFGKIRLEALRLHHLDKYEASKASAGRLDGKEGGLSPRTVNHHLSTLITIINHAVDREKMVMPVWMRKLKKPGTKKTIPEYALTREEVQKLHEASEGTRFDPYILVAATTGLHRSEQMGLLWEDIDFENNYISINKSVHEYKAGIWTYEPCKNDYRFRTIPMHDSVRTALWDFRFAAQQSISGWSEKTPVFANANGNPYRMNSVTDGVKELMMKIGLDKRANLKSLRHSFATVLIERGVAMEIVRDLMGHSSIMTTASHYTHVRPQVRDTAMSVF